MGFHGLTALVHEQRKMFRSIDETCSEHEVNLVQYQEKTPFCPMCATERATADEADLIEQETVKAMSSDSRWLKQRSVVTDKNMFNMTFESFEIMDEETKVNKGKALNIARSYYKGAKNNELLTGRFGTGKTHLAMAILNQLNEHQGIKALFVSTDELMRNIKSSFGNPDSPYQESIVVDTLIQADLLALDDLGAEVGSIDRQSSATDYTVRVLNAILNGRTNKPTIITTNLSMKELKKVYDGRLLSRMFRGVKQERIIQFRTTSDKRSNLKF